MIFSPPTTSSLDAVQNPNQIRQHTHSRNLRTSTRSLDNKRVSIPLRHNADNIITSLQSRNRAVLVKSLDTDLSLSTLDVQRSNIAEDLSSLISLGLAGRDGTVKGLKASEELLGGSNGLELSGDKRLDREAGWELNGETGQAGEDGELASNIKTVQVVPRVGLSVSSSAGLSDNLAEWRGRHWRGGVEGVEEEGHGSGEDAINLLNLVAGSDEVIDGGEDGETSAYGGLVEDEASGGVGWARSLLDLVPVGDAGGESLLVGSDNVDAGVEESRVSIGEGLVRGVVYQDGRAGGSLEEGLEASGNGWWSASSGSEVSLPVGQVESGVVVRDEGSLGPGEEDGNQLPLGVGGNVLLELGDEGLADGASTCLN